jgi:hypothetical protein
MTINESDFDVISVREVRHRATGARFATYEYVNVDDTGSSVTVSPGTAGDGNNPTTDQLLPHAVRLLRRLAIEARQH